MTAQPGTCNVCASYSSLFFLIKLLRSWNQKIRITFQMKSARVKNNEANLCFKDRACDDRWCTTSNACNLLNSSLSHDPLAENAESTAALRSCGTSDAMEDVQMLKKLPRSPCALMMTKDSCQDKFSFSTSVTAGFSQKSESSDSPSSKDVYIGDNPQNLQLPHSHSPVSDKFLSRVDSKDLEENSSSQNQEEPFECSIELAASSLAGPVTNNNVNGQKSSALDSSCILPNNKVSKPNFEQIFFFCGCVGNCN